MKRFFFKKKKQIKKNQKMKNQKSQKEREKEKKKGKYGSQRSTPKTGQKHDFVQRNVIANREAVEAKKQILSTQKKKKKEKEKKEKKKSRTPPFRRLVMYSRELPSKIHFVSSADAKISSKPIISRNASFRFLKSLLRR